MNKDYSTILSYVENNFESKLYLIYFGTILPGSLVYYSDLDSVLPRLCFDLSNCFYCGVGILCAVNYGVADGSIR